MEGLRSGQQGAQGEEDEHGEVQMYPGDDVLQWVGNMRGERSCCSPATATEPHLKKQRSKRSSISWDIEPDSTFHQLVLSNYRYYLL